VPRGELDLATAPVIERRLADLRDAGFRVLVLDLRRVTFIDVAGLRLILRWTQRGDVVRFAVIPGSRAVQRIFGVTATRGDVDFVDACGARSRERPRRRSR
jgi:anti-anti-sigma factor